MQTPLLNQLTLTTPALMFPAISLLLLAYTNRFLSLAGLIRTLSDTYQDKPNDKLLRQIISLRKRLNLIKWMQVAGVSSLLLSVVVMFFLYIGWATIGYFIFAVAMVLLIISLVLSVKELYVSNEALNIRLSDMELQTKGK
ncbi:MAG: II family cellulose-binding protein [Gammaproteobacteria bacterium]|nr:MAG: II family cellulose-binding protein [Gammaproteobacteria bacterium]